ncbi:hypothetical protein B0H11DRAFT_1942811 [Mycena galericulata]|nr:hypothetical protein B0H11DRAFT_1942811 [Mycena galericulata]
MADRLVTFKSARREIRGTQIVADDLECFEKGSRKKVPGTTMNVVGALIQLLAERDRNSDFAVFSSWLSPLISRQIPQGKIYGTIAELITAAPWKVHHDSPPVLMRQMNGWAFGFFTIHAIQVVAKGQSTTVVTNERTDHIQKETLEMILNNLPLLEKKNAPLPVAGDMSDCDMGAAEDFEPENDPTINDHDESGTPGPAEDLKDMHGAELSRDSTPLASRQLFEAANNAMEEDSEPPKKKRGIKTSEAERREVLENNKWISEVEPHRVRCGGCKEWVKLTSTRPYKPNNWTRHESKCSQITGVRRVRTAVKESAAGKVVGRASIGSFFNKPSKTPTTVAVAAKIPAAVNLSLNRPAEDLPAIAKSSKKTEDPDSDTENSKSKTTYTTHIVTATPSIANIFAPGPIKNPPPKIKIIPKLAPCKHLSGDEYIEYIERTETRTMGGISPTLCGRVVRQILFYKELAALKEQGPVSESTSRSVETSIPTNGNDCIASRQWTTAEHVKLDENLQGYARWEVNFAKKTIRSTHCEGLTLNVEGICGACRKVSIHPSLLRSIRRKKQEAALPLDEQHEILMNRNKYSSRLFTDIEARKLQDLLRDPTVFKAFQALEKDEPTDCFIQIYEAARDGKLKKHETVSDLFKVVGEMLKREGIDKKYGMRYPARYLNFMILMRSYGGNSSRQYGILSGELPCPSRRHLRTLVANSEDALRNPTLVYENIARVKRLADSIKYSGPVAVAGDCTKVRKRLTYSNDFGGHILGGVLPLEECIAEDREDIERIPLPHIPPQVVALLPTDEKDDADKIVEEHLKLLKMAAELKLPVISFAADGAASELATQNFMDRHTTPFPPVTYDYPLYGVHLHAPVMETGPVVSNTDGPHARKNGRNQPQHGTKTASMGKEVLVNDNLVQLYETGESGMLHRDVNNTDKQDDGPACRIFHHQALLACTVGDGDQTKIRDGFGGVFVYLFVLGTLFDAWLNRTMSVENRVLTVLRARFFLHFWRAHIVYMSTKYPDLYSTTRSFISPASFHIFNRLCDTLLLLVIIYTRYYPDQPFCPWLLGTEFVEHFFGLARMMLPDFTYAEFLKIVQHVMVRQRILLSGSFREKRERKAGLGYVLDFDASPLTAEDLKLAKIRVTDADMNSLVELAFKEAKLICTQLLHIPAPTLTLQKPLSLTPLGVPPAKTKFPQDDEISEDSDLDSDPDCDIDVEVGSTPVSVKSAARHAARYSALCDDYAAAVEEAESAQKLLGPPPPPSTPLCAPLRRRPGAWKLSIAMMVQARLHLQSGTTTKSEKIVRIDSKYALSRIARGNDLDNDDDTEPEKMTIQEASNTVRVLQSLNSATQASKSNRSHNPKAGKLECATKHLSKKCACSESPVTYTVTWNGTRFYVGEILDVYKQGASSRYGSIRNPTTTSGLAYISMRVYLSLTTARQSSLLLVPVHADFSIQGADSDDEDDRDPTEINAPVFSCRDKLKSTLTRR